VVDQILDARKELEKVLVQQITAFTKYWKQRLVEKNSKTKESVEMATAELEKLLNKVFEDETTKAALWKMIRVDESGA
jgi:vacuolar-type H+-ATPase subunit H